MLVEVTLLHKGVTSIPPASAYLAKGGGREEGGKGSDTVPVYLLRITCARQSEMGNSNAP